MLTFGLRICNFISQVISELKTCSKYWRWRGVETQDASFRALDVEVRNEEKAKDPRVTLRTYVSR